MYIEGCSEDCMYLFLFSLFLIHYILYIGLVTILTYIVLIFVLYISMYVLSPIPPCVVSFHLYTHVSYIMYAIYYLCFTIRYLDEFCLKCFEIQVVKVYLPLTLFMQSFSRVCVRIDFIVFNK